MAIEGRLRELGIHDVFQMLDLSRKTGTLTVVSALRDNSGTVHFDRGAVVHASIRSNPHRIGEFLRRAGKITAGQLEQARAEQDEHGRGRRLGEILVEMGAITWRELERQVRFQIEEVVFELMSWRDGFFSFEEGPAPDRLADATVRIGTESLLMEGARRIDEWSRMERRIPHLGVVPVIASVGTPGAGSRLDLRPSEWEVLCEVDGVSDLRAIALRLARSEFELAKTVYGLISTGVLDVVIPAAESPPPEGTAWMDAREQLRRAADALAASRVEEALQTARAAIAADPTSAEARLLLARALGRLGRHEEAADALRRASQLDPTDPEIARETGDCAARRGDLDTAVAAWRRYLGMTPEPSGASMVRECVDTVVRLQRLLRERVDG